MGVFCRKEESTMNTLKDVKCGQTVRVPKHRGKLCIRCPKCGEKFIRKT